MTTSAAVRAAWASAIWEHSSVTALTDKILDYDALANIEARTESSGLYYEQKINAFTYIVSRRTLANEIQGAAEFSQFEIEVEVSYYLEKDLRDSSTNYNNVIDRLETVDALVLSQLGVRWSDTVNYWQQSELERPEIVKIDGKEVWRGRIRYAATSFS